MAGTNMTWLFIGTAAFILIVVLGTSFYTDMMVSNNGSIDTAYAAKYAQIAGYNNQVNALGNTLTQNVSIWSQIPTTLGNTFNVLAIGLNGVTQLFGLIGIVPPLFAMIFNDLSLPTAFISFLVLVLGVFIATKVYKAIRGQPEEA